MSSENRFDDGCSSGDDLEYYERGMPPWPPRYSLSFSYVRRQVQRLTNADKRLISQWFYPPRTYDDRRLRNPMRHLPGYVVVHLDSVVAGLNFPLHGFHLELFRALEIVPAQFVPAAYRIIAGFIIRCHSVGVTPTVDLLHHFFRLSPFGRTGYLTLIARPSMVLFSNNAGNPDGWEERFFLAGVGSPMPFSDRWNAYPVKTIPPPMTDEELGYAKRIAGLGIQNLRSLVAEPFKAQAGLGASVCTCIVLTSLRCYGSERLGSFCAGVFPSTSVMSRINTASSAAGRDHKGRDNPGKPLVPKVEPRVTRARADETSGVGAPKRPRVEGTSSNAIILADDSDGEPGSPLKRKPTSRAHLRASPPRNSDVRRLRDDDAQAAKGLDDARPNSPPGASESSLGLIEFSGVGPRKESMMLFGQTASSIWCGLNLKVPQDFAAQEAPEDLLECGQSTLDKAGLYFHRARMAFKRQGREMARVRAECDALLRSAKGRAGTLQEKAEAYDKLVQENASQKELLKKQEAELVDLRSRMWAVEQAKVELRQTGMDNHVPIYEADVAKIKESGSIAFQRSKAYTGAIHTMAMKFLPRLVGEFLATCPDAYLDGVKLLQATPTGRRFLNDLADDTYRKGMVGLVAENLPTFERHFGAPFDPEAAGFDVLMADAHAGALELLREQAEAKASEECVQALSKVPAPDVDQK
ncbi:unnamed protein product [Cuscuta epithymum]|uniref:Transposase (putative) gypsy type domain-containing protein n=1 Tax=Cuscuta epithymum TaxID=186058 RepID=A0AAV0E9N7_9ASTE|nr:unnamed protein product [Cuscuta epithymum]